MTDFSTVVFTNLVVALLFTRHQKCRQSYNGRVSVTVILSATTDNSSVVDVCESPGELINVALDALELQNTVQVKQFQKFYTTRRKNNELTINQARKFQQRVNGRVPQR